MGNITFSPSFPPLYWRLWGSTELSVQPHFTASFLEHFPLSLSPLREQLGTSFVPYSGGAVTHCQAVLVCGVYQFQLVSVDPLGHSWACQCCWWCLWEKILNKGQKSHRGRGMGGERREMRNRKEKSRVREGRGQGGAPLKRAGATCSRWRGPWWSRYHQQTLEDHSGATGTCEEEGAAVLTSSTCSPSQGGGRGVEIEGVRLSLGKGAGGRVLVLLLFLVLQIYFNWQ